LDDLDDLLDDDIGDGGGPNAESEAEPTDSAATDTSVGQPIATPDGSD